MIDNTRNNEQKQKGTFFFIFENLFLFLWKFIKPLFFLANTLSNTVLPHFLILHHK